VFGGMILASFLGIFVIPPLYVSFQAVRERLRPAARPHGSADGNAVAFPAPAAEKSAAE